MAGWRGLYKPVNPSKYKGDIAKIVYRSSWELKLFRYLDLHPSIITWAADGLDFDGTPLPSSIGIPYHDKTTGKLRRYFPDAWVKRRNKDGTETIIILEVKPEEQTRPPKAHKGKKPTKRQFQEAVTFQRNVSKWEAAKRFCDKYGFEFKILSERHLGVS